MKKMMKFATMVACALVMFCIVGCGGGTPESIAQDVVKCFKNADFKGAGEYGTEDFKKGMAMIQGLADAAGEKAKKECAEAKYEIGPAKIDGDKATVEIKTDGKSKTMKFVKVNGAWKVEDFNLKG